MTNVLAPIANRLGKLIRMLSSNQDGDVLNAARAIVRTLDNVGLDVHALAAGIGAPANDKKFSEEEARNIYQHGVAEGRRAAEQEQNSPVFRNVNLNDEPSWHDIACECAAHSARLRDERERKFVNDMVRWTVHGGEPTEKQAKWLRSIYARVR